MQDIYTSKGTSLHQINALAEWVRISVARVNDGTLDVIRFVELDLPKIIPGLHLEIESDDLMGRTRAYVRADGIGIVVAESIYNSAVGGCLSATETILHEIGHIFLHRTYAYKDLNDSRGIYTKQFHTMGPMNIAEWQARMFAFCMLFPYSVYGKYTDRLQIQVYTNYSISICEKIARHVRLMRLREADYKPEKTKEFLQKILASNRIGQQAANQPETAQIQLSFFYNQKTV